jgi:hypothetical protein
LYFVGITTAYSWGWGHNTHCCIFWHRLEKVDNTFPAGRCCWIRRIWFREVKLKYITGNEAIRPWKVLSRSFQLVCVYWTLMLWASGMIHWSASVYCTLQSSPRRSRDVGQWNGWQ